MRKILNTKFHQRLFTVTLIGILVGQVNLIALAQASTTPNASNSNNREAVTPGTLISNRLGMKFAYTPAGTFQMGDKDYGPIHTVTLSQGFFLGRTEVTQAQWVAVMGRLPTKCQNGKFKREFIGNNKPIICVSWDDVKKYIRKLNARGEGSYRLPTEAEWEYAARAGTTGDYAGNLDAMAWYLNNSENKTHEVATKQPNGWGLYDMHGNVWEWVVEELVGDHPSGSGTDPQGATPNSYRVIRGGGFFNSAGFLRSAGRGGDIPSGANYIGFRLIRTR